MTSLLLDTHTFVWYANGDAQLPDTARAAVEGATDVFVSAASAWELATKHRLGRIPEANRVATDVAGSIIALGFRPLPVTVADGQRAGALRGAHQDPFDRMLAAQALARELPLVSNDAALDAFGVRRVW